MQNKNNSVFLKGSILVFSGNRDLSGYFKRITPEQPRSLTIPQDDRKEQS
jgi:hypothetical protein